MPIKVEKDRSRAVKIHVRVEGHAVPVTVH
jgi:hypothetical protein